MNLYLLPHEVETGLGPDTLPVERGECTPAEIRSSVAEAGTPCGDMRITGETGASSSGKPAPFQGLAVHKTTGFFLSITAVARDLVSMNATRP